MKDGAIEKMALELARVDTAARREDRVSIADWRDMLRAIAEHGKPADDAPRGDGGEAARACANMSPALCGEVFVDPDTGVEDAANPCVLPAGHDDERHQNAKLHHWYPIVSRKPTVLPDPPAPLPIDAAEAIDAYDAGFAAGKTYGEVHSPATLEVARLRLALNCGLTADERREPAYLVTCRSRGAPCAACELARCHGTVAHFRARLKRREAELDAEIDKAEAIRGALGCRDGETTLGVARRYPLEVDRLIVDNVALSGERAQLAKERDAYHASARANGEQRDRFAARFARLLSAVAKAPSSRGWTWAEVDALRSVAAEVSNGGAPVDPRDAEIAAMAEQRRLVREALGCPSDYGIAAWARRFAEDSATEIARLTRERDALVAAGVALRDEVDEIWCGPSFDTAWAALLALLPAKTPAVTLTFWGPAEDMWS